MKNLLEGVNPKGRPRAWWTNRVHKDMRRIGLEEEDSRDEKSDDGLLLRLRSTILGINGHGHSSK